MTAGGAGLNLRNEGATGLASETCDIAIIRSSTRMTTLAACANEHAQFRYISTGKERDSESGLDNFGFRYYASTMGRFMSPDPLGGHLELPGAPLIPGFGMNGISRP